jgi:hypothetical protein
MRGDSRVLISNDRARTSPRRMQNPFRTAVWALAVVNGSLASILGTGLSWVLFVFFLHCAHIMRRRSAPLHDNSRFESAGFTIRREEAHDFVQRNLTID